MKRRAGIYWYLVLLAVYLWLLPAVPVRAHGVEGKIVLDQVAAGPYTLTVRQSPETARVGQVYFAVVVSENGRPVSDCIVEVKLLPLAHPVPVIKATVPAPQIGHTWYEANLTLADAGSYRAVVTVRAASGRSGAATFEIEVRPSSPWLLAFIHIQLALAPPIGLWLLQQGLVIWGLGKRSRPLWLPTN